MGGDDERPARARAYGQLVALVVLGEDEHVLVAARADPVAPHLVRPEEAVRNGVEEGRRVRAPGPGVVRALDGVVEIVGTVFLLPGAEEDFEVLEQNEP